MLDNDIYWPCMSPRSSLVVLVPKKTGEYRFATDFRAVNQVTRVMNFPLPRSDDVVDTIAASKAVYFTVLDLASGFWQIPVSESSKEKTCFVTESGTYWYKRMPFAVVNAPSVFSMVMSEILRGINWIHALVYVDDIVVFLRSLEEHQQHLQDIFDKLKEAGLKLQPSKCHFAAKKVTYLGHNFSKEGVSVDISKTECVASFPIRMNRTDVRSFLGLATYYKRLVKGFSHIAAPLYKLLGESTKFEFTEECKTAFENLKQALVTAPILRYPDFDKEFFLYCDSFVYSIGYILGQKDDEGREVVIHYGGRALRPPEINYPITHKEGLALVEGIKYYHIYLMEESSLSLQIIKLLNLSQQIKMFLVNWPGGQFTCNAMIFTLFTSQARNMVMLMHCQERLILSPLNQKKMVMKFWQTYNFN